MLQEDALLRLIFLLVLHAMRQCSTTSWCNLYVAILNSEGRISQRRGSMYNAIPLFPNAQSHSIVLHIPFLDIVYNIGPHFKINAAAVNMHVYALAFHVTPNLCTTRRKEGLSEKNITEQ